MGQMRFYTPAPETLLPHAVELAYVAGLEAIPWRSCNSMSNNILTVERAVSESGNLYVPWNVPEVGERVLTTCTLMERDEPYRLTCELARGTLHRARRLAAEMESGGVPIPPPVEDVLRDALAAFFSATTNSSGAGERSASQAIQLACQAIEALSAAHVTVMLARRTEKANGVPVILVGPVSDSSVPDSLNEQFVEAFHAISVPLRWRQCQPSASSPNWALGQRWFEWSRTHGLRTLAGPLIQLDHFSLPEWAYALEDTYEAFEVAATEYVRASVEQFKDQVDIWMCAGRLNVPGTLDFSEEQKLRLAVATLKTAHAAAPRTPVAISFDQPWAEYLAAEDFDLSPLHFADALVRADLGVAAVALEINLGYWPGGTQPRDLLAISEHIDHWSLLGIPLLVYVTLPSRAGADANSTGPARVVPHSPDRPERPATGHEWAGDLIRLLLTKPALHGIVWNQWSDADEHEFPHSGLLDASHEPKPLLGTLRSIRQQYVP